MEEYIFSADLLNKYSQLTPWVQSTIGIIFASMVLGIAYFFKESIAALMRPFISGEGNKDEKRGWKDKHYHGEEK